jgi:hypothetical protein
MQSRILFVESGLTDSDNPMSTLYNLKCNKIKEKYDYFDISTELNIDISNYDVLILGCRTIYIYKYYKNHKKKNLLKENFDKLMGIKKKFMILQDMHSKTYGSLDDLTQILNDNKINIIFTFYKSFEANIIRKKTPNCKYHHLPHYIDTEIFNLNESNKSIDILLFGAIHPTHYPFRKRLFEIILNNKDKFPNVTYIEKPETFDPNLCEKGLAKILNQSKIAISTKSKYDYLVAKYLEIPACNCLVIGDIPSDADSELIKNIIEIKNTQTDGEIINIIQNTLKYYETFKNKILEYQKYVTNTYNLNKYIDKLEEIINNTK